MLYTKVSTFGGRSRVSVLRPLLLIAGALAFSSLAGAQSFSGGTITNGSRSLLVSVHVSDPTGALNANGVRADLTGPGVMANSGPSDEVLILSHAEGDVWQGQVCVRSDYPGGVGVYKARIFAPDVPGIDEPVVSPSLTILPPAAYFSLLQVTLDGAPLGTRQVKCTGGLLKVSAKLDCPPSAPQNLFFRADKQLGGAVFVPMTLDQGSGDVYSGQMQIADECVPENVTFDPNTGKITVGPQLGTVSWNISIVDIAYPAVLPATKFNQEMCYCCDGITVIILPDGKGRSERFVGDMSDHLKNAVRYAMVAYSAASLSDPARRSKIQKAAYDRAAGELKKAEVP